MSLITVFSEPYCFDTDFAFYCEARGLTFSNINTAAVLRGIFLLKYGE